MDTFLLLLNKLSSKQVLFASMPSILFMVFHSKQQNQCDKAKLNEETMKQALRNNDQNVSCLACS